MKIIRDGKEFELTEQELFDAYREMEYRYDMEDLENVCEVNEYNLTDSEKEVIVERYRDKFESEDWFGQLAYWCEKIIRERKC